MLTAMIVTGSVMFGASAGFFCAGLMNAVKGSRYEQWVSDQEQTEFLRLWKEARDAPRLGDIPDDPRDNHRTTLRDRVFPLQD